jgi:hypothetical protein
MKKQESTDSPKVTSVVPKKKPANKSISNFEDIGKSRKLLSKMKTAKFEEDDQKFDSPLLKKASKLSKLLGKPKESPEKA